VVSGTHIDLADAEWAGAGEGLTESQGSGFLLGVMPNLFIVAGPNGAGKSTYMQRFLPKEVQCSEFVNADLIAAGLSPFAPERAAFAAGRIMLNRLRELMSQGVDFSFETTLSGRGYVPLLQQCRAVGYRLRLDFLWVPELDITRSRVKQRVVQGGHDIPENVQQRRFELGLRNLATLYRPLLDEWWLYENTKDKPRLIAFEEDGELGVVDATRLDFIERSASVQFMNPPKENEFRVSEPQGFYWTRRQGAGMRAMRLAYADVILKNLQLGHPVIQWRDDVGVVEVPPEQLAPFARRILEVNGEPLPEEEERELLSGLTV